jgi:hypothetical protein
MRTKRFLLSASAVALALLAPITVTTVDGKLQVNSNDACAQTCTPQPLCDECSPALYYTCSDRDGFIVVENHICVGGNCS